MEYNLYIPYRWRGGMKIKGNMFMKHRIYISYLLWIAQRSNRHENVNHGTWDIISIFYGRRFDYIVYYDKHALQENKYIGYLLHIPHLLLRKQLLIYDTSDVHRVIHAHHLEDSWWCVESDKSYLSCNPCHPTMGHVISYCLTSLTMISDYANP